MPIENERKIILRPDVSETIFSEVANSLEIIEQSYLMCGKKQSARIRKTLISYPASNQSDLKFSFTFKQDVGKKTVEIETPIDISDYNLLSREASLVVNKNRYRINDWEIDFFKKNNIIYFVQAEIELPDGIKKPKEIHPLVQENLIYIVKRGDGRFSNKKLGDIFYAKKLLQLLMIGATV